MSYRIKIFLIMLMTLIFQGSFAQNSTLQDSLAGDSSVIVENKLSTNNDSVAVKSDNLQSSLETISTLDSTRPDIGWSVSVAKLFWSLVVFSVGFLTIRYVARFLETLAEHRPEIRLTLKAVIPVIRIIGWNVVLYIIIARIIAPPIETLLAVTASAGIAVGFASQDILKNIFGGVVILFDRPFQVGDKIEVGNYYGEVLTIGLRTVRIVTPDDSIVSVPNSEVVNQSVSNANVGESNCQVVAEFFLPSTIDTDKAKRIATRAAMVSPYIYLNKPVYVIFKNEIHEGRSMIKMRLKAYVFDIRMEFAFMSDMTSTVIDEFLKQGLVESNDLLLSCKN